MNEPNLIKVPARKLRILGIAPYEGLKTAMIKAAQSRPDLELDAFVGDLDEGLRRAEHEHVEEYDVVISRGGTAELLRRNLTIPVIEIPISVYDILRAIKLAECYEHRYAFVGFAGLTDNAHLLCSMLQYDLDIYTIHSEEEASEVLNALKEQGYKMVLCDMITSTIAKHISLNAILITSGLESIETAFNYAEQLALGCARLEHENRLLHRLLGGGTEQVLVLNEKHDVFFSSIPQTLLPGLLEALEQDIPTVFEKGSCKFFKNLDGTLYSFFCRRITSGNQTYAAFYFFSSAVPFIKSKYGIEYATFKDIEDSAFNSLYHYISSNSDLQTITGTLASSNSPVLLIGEPGCGKIQAAHSIYSLGPQTSNPLITVNCTLVTDKSWEFLVNHYNSPLNDNNNTIFFRNLNVLTPERLRQLFSLIRDTNLARRDRLIFSCTTGADYKLPEEVECYVSSLSCARVCLPPLRAHASEIPTLISLYLNTLNVRTANQIIGVDRESVKILRSYDWPGNYTQFKRVLNQLALITTTPYISAEHVRTQLALEDASLKQNEADEQDSSESRTGIDLSGSLADINRRIVEHVLEECGGNHTVAAKRLGISRSTLWRYLK